jgi:hypothetical protein
MELLVRCSINLSVSKNGIDKALANLLPKVVLPTAINPIK